MKYLFILLAVFSMNVFAEECSPDAQVNIDNISKKATCYEASALAEECAWGSSIDVQIAGAAGEVCLKEAGKLSASDKALLVSMRDRCTKAYSKLQGTMYRSMNSFCHLDAIKFINNVKNAGKN